MKLSKKVGRREHSTIPNQKQFESFVADKQTFKTLYPATNKSINLSNMNAFFKKKPGSSKYYEELIQVQKKLKKRKRTLKNQVLDISKKNNRYDDASIDPEMMLSSTENSLPPLERLS